MAPTLNNAVQRRISALKQLRLDAIQLEAKMDEEIQILKATKYQSAMEPLVKKCAAIISGEYEPEDSECVWPHDDMPIAPSESEVNAADADQMKGIPQFWMTVLKNSDVLGVMIQVHDEPILRHLADVRVVYAEADPLQLCIEFHFNENDFFDNAVLTRTYQMSCTPKPDDPFTFEGPYIVSSTGTSIRWKEGRNVTVKPQKSSTGMDGDLTRHRKSFFNFFNPATFSDDEKKRDYDFKVAEELRDSIIPMAVLYYNDDPWLYETDSDNDYTTSSDTEDSSDDSD